MSEPSKRVRKPSKAWLRSRGLPTDSESESGSDDDICTADVGASDTIIAATPPVLAFSQLAVPAPVSAQPPRGLDPTSVQPQGLSRQSSAASITAAPTASSTDPSRRAAFEKRYANMTDEEILGKPLDLTSSQ